MVKFKFFDRNSTDEEVSKFKKENNALDVKVDEHGEYPILVVLYKEFIDD